MPSNFLFGSRGHRRMRLWKLGWPPPLPVVSTLVVFVLQSCSAAQAPRQIVSVLGDDITLPCNLDPSVDAADMTVEWTRSDLRPRFVHVWRDGVELDGKKHAFFRNRTSLGCDCLKHGDASLTISRVRLSDAGEYRCFIPTLKTESTVQLLVGAASSLTIAVATHSSRTLLSCGSRGWYPEPELSWLDAEGKLLCAEAAETFRGDEELFDVSSSLKVEEGDGRTFTCRVQQRNISQSREAHIQLPDGSSCRSPAQLLLSSAIGLSCVAAAVCVVCRCGAKRSKETPPPPSSSSSAAGLHDVREPLTASDGSHPSPAVTQVQQQGAPCWEEPPRNRGEVDTVLKVINDLVVQLKDLTQQRGVVQRCHKLPVERSRGRKTEGERMEQERMEREMADVDQQIEELKNAIRVMTKYKMSLQQLEDAVQTDVLHTAADEAIRIGDQD